MPGDTRDGGHSPPDGGARLFERARCALAEEQRRTADEREAFADFRRRVREVRPASAPTAGGETGGVRAVALADRPRETGTATVRRAYRETVMDVPHFDAEYDETCAESVAEELGRDLAAALVAGERFDPVCKRTLLDRAEERHSRRVTLVEALDAERESLAAVEKRISSVRDDLASVAIDGTALVERVGTDAPDGRDPAPRLPAGVSFDALADRHADLRGLEERCDAVAADRQTTIQAEAARFSLPVGTADVPSYCYQSLPVTYPALSAVTDLSDRVATCRCAVERGTAGP